MEKLTSTCKVNLLAQTRRSSFKKYKQNHHGEARPEHVDVTSKHFGAWASHSQIDKVKQYYRDCHLCKAVVEHFFFPFHGKKDPKKSRLLSNWRFFLTTKFFFESRSLRHEKTMVHPHVAQLIEINARVNGTAGVQKTAAWHEKRARHITCSLLGSLMRRHGAPESQNMIIKRSSGIVPPFRGNFMTQHGEKYEDRAREIYEQRSGEKVIEFGCLSYHEVHGADAPAKYALLAGSPDGVTQDTAKLIEIKCPVKRVIVPGVVPEHYMDQIQGLMFIFGLKVTVFIQFKPAECRLDGVNEDFLDVVEIPFDKNWINECLPTLSDCWKTINDIRAQRLAIGVESDPAKKERLEKDFQKQYAYLRLTPVVRKQTPKICPIVFSTEKTPAEGEGKV